MSDSRMRPDGAQHPAPGQGVPRPAPDDGREWHEIIGRLEGEEVISSLGMEIITGYPGRELLDSNEKRTGAVRRGRQLAREAAARTGSYDLHDNLEYLARRAGYDVTDPYTVPVYAARREVRNV